MLGADLLITCAPQVVGCLLGALEARGLAGGTYSSIGLALVALLIIDAVWLLNDKTVTRALWSGEAETGCTDESLSGMRDPADAQATSPFEARVEAAAAAHALTPREKDVLGLFARGRSSSYIAEALSLSTNTVRSHISHIYAKCDVHSRQELITMVDEADVPESVAREHS